MLRGIMKRKSDHAETKAVRGAARPGEEERAAGYADLPDFDFRGHRQRGEVRVYATAIIITRGMAIRRIRLRRRPLRNWKAWMRR